MSLSVEHDRIKDTFFSKKGFDVIFMKLPFLPHFHILVIEFFNSQIHIEIWYIHNCKTELVYKIVLRYNLVMHFIFKLQWIAMHKISCFSDILIRLWILICISSVYNLLRPIIQLLYIQMILNLWGHEVK